jgi:hypothetical protein
MRRNFSLRSEVTLYSGDSIFDLHNDYGFSGFSYNPKGELNLTWASLSDGIQGLLIAFRAVSWLRIETVGPRSRVDENSCLDFVGFLHPDDEAIMDGFLFEDQSSIMHHLIFRFNGGLAIRAYAESAEVRLVL